MDDRRFDALARAVTTGAPRRAVVQFLGAGTLAGLWGAVGGNGHDAEAKCKKPCGPCRVCKKGKCKKKKPDGTPCGNGQSCVSGTCVDVGCSGTLHDCGAAGCQECCFGQTGSNGQCCPAETPDCLSRDGNRARACAQGGSCACPANYPYFWAAFGGWPQCWECEVDGHCTLPPNELANSQGRTHCFHGNCVCPDSTPDLCRVFGGGGLHCTNILTDPESCGDCVIVCNREIGQTCVNGGCQNPGPS